MGRETGIDNALAVGFLVVERPITVFAPGRVDLSAGFTDVEPFCIEVPGRVVNVALNLGVEVTIRGRTTRPPGDSFVDRLCDAVARRLAMARPELWLASSALPSGSGLGASGALSVALAYALSLRAGASVHPVDVIELACAAEWDTGLTGGTQDQLASAYGGAGLVERHRGIGSRNCIDVRLGTLSQHLLLVHRGGARNSGSIIDEVLRDSARTRALRTIRAMSEVAELTATSLSRGDYGRLGELLDESTTLLRDLHVDIVDDETRELLSALGAAAAKPCGAGGRSAVWAVLVDPEIRSAVAAGIRSAGWSVLPAAPDRRGVRLARPAGPNPRT